MELVLFETPTPGTAVRQDAETSSDEQLIASLVSGNRALAGELHRRLWRSIDGGVHWGRVAGAGRVALAVTTTPARRGRVLVATPEVRWSDDYGQTWHRTGFEARLLASDPRNPDVFFAVTEDGYLRASSDGGKHW